MHTYGMHTHSHPTLTESTSLPSFGQETAQCSEAPFSIFVVMSAWLLREEGLRMAQGPRRGVGRHKTGGAVAEQCRKKSGCRATNSPGLGWGEGPPGGEQRLSHSCCSKEGHLALLPPPPGSSCERGLASFTVGQSVAGTVSVILPLGILAGGPHPLHVQAPAFCTAA